MEVEGSDSLVGCDVRCGVSQTEIPIGLGACLVAHAHTVAAMPEQPTPPRVHLGRSPTAASLLAQHPSVLVLDVLVSTCARRFL